MAFLKSIKNAFLWRLTNLKSVLNSLLRVSILFHNPEELSRNDAYRYFHLKYLFGPIFLKRHRFYFRRRRRGYGEDAFHGAWLYLFKKYRFQKCLEIGIYRGQTISLWSLLGKKLKFKTEVVGISPLSSSGDGVSIYPNIDYERDVKENFKKFKLQNPRLIKSYSTTTVAISAITSGDWDLIYIDGSHDFEVCKQDFIHSLKGLRVGGLMAIDDSSLYSDFDLSFKGHPGPSRVVDSLVPANLKHVYSIGHLNIFQKIE